ncbi:unnamed protein product [Prunus armeniaca]
MATSIKSVRMHVRDVRLIMDRNSRRSKGVGYIEFYDAMSVPMAIALSGQPLLGQPVMVKPSEAEKNLVESTSVVSGPGGMIGPYSGGARRLYVGNLHTNIKEDDLRQVFGAFGPVELVQLPVDETNNCKGFGFVQFSRLEDARNALSLNGKLEIAGRLIKVSAVTDQAGMQDLGANAGDFDDDDGGGLNVEEIKSKFEEAFGLPNCCGAIDGTHIILSLPTVQTSDDWCDLEDNYSMLLQGIVEHEMRFFDVVTGWPGGMTVSRLLKCSGFFNLCEGGQRLNENVRTLSGGVEIREYFVGGVGYPLLPWLITPYESNGLPASISAFNAVHGAARSLAVKAFMQLKGTWRILNKVMWRADKRKLPSIILVCCLLHNKIDSRDILQPDVAFSGHHDSGYGEQCCRKVDPLGRTMRDILVKHLLHSKQTAAPK